MKRFTSIVLLLFFLSGNSYSAINIHYCGGELQSINFFTQSKSCVLCGMKSSSNKCCKDVQKILKADDFNKFHTNYSIKSLSIVILPIYNTFKYNLGHTIVHSLLTNFGAPPNYNYSIYLLICSFVI